MTRRIRQHNGHIGGGAHRTTKHRPHCPLFIVSGFPTERAALQFEWAMKHKRAPKSSGQKGRIRTAQRLFVLPRWTKNSPWQATLKLTVRTKLTRAQYIARLDQTDTTSHALVRDSFNIRYIFGLSREALVRACTPAKKSKKRGVVCNGRK